MGVNICGRSFLKLFDYSPEEITYLLDLSRDFKNMKRAGVPHRYLEGKNIALLFEKTSTRTRAAFTTAAIDLGAHPEYLGKNDIQLGNKETVLDTAKVLGSMFDGIEFRGFKQEHVELLATYSGVPVWNGLTDREHPTQMLADFMTMHEEFGHLEGLNLSYFGTGKNNVQNSLMITSAILGVNYRLATPKELMPEQSVIDDAKRFAEKSGATIEITNDPIEAAEPADVVYTNVWAAMGEESQFAERVRLLKPYQVNAELVSHVKNPDWIFEHCLPAFHDLNTGICHQIGEKFHLEALEVTDEVFECDHGRQFEEAENRMHTIKAIMAATLGNLYIPKV